MLDFRDGVLRRRVHWRSPVGGQVRVTSTRIVSLAQRGAAAILYEVEPVDDPIRVVVQSELIANQDGRPQAPESADPRAAAVTVAAAVRRGALPARPARAPRPPRGATAAC